MQMRMQMTVFAILEACGGMSSFRVWLGVQNPVNSGGMSMVSAMMSAIQTTVCRKKRKNM